MTKETKYFKQFPETQITYINKVKNESWPAWKKWNECDDKERQQANLRTIFPNEVILDIEEEPQLQPILNQLDEKAIKYLLCKTGSRGYHIHIFYYNLHEYSKDIRNAIRKKIIKQYNTDETKASENTLIAITNRPHFKTMVNKEVITDKSEDDFNLVPKNIILELRQEKEDEVQKSKEIKINNNFTNYFESDPVFLELKNRTEILPEGTRRNDVLLKNISIAAAKSGKTEQEFETIFKPIMERVMPDIPWKQIIANGSWYKKALNGELEDYNPVEMNKWSEAYLKKQLYDLRPLSIVEQLETKQTPETTIHQRFLSDKEFEERPELDIRWLIGSWIAEGDISFLAGKAASYKSTIAAHIAYCTAENKPVFNTYPVNQCKVLYINEENNFKLFKKLIKRVKKGLSLEQLKSENLFLSTMENFKIDEVEDIKTIISFIKLKDIKFVILDSFRRFFIGKENDADVINRIFETLKYVRKECGDITILALHHAKKDGQNGNEDIRDILRGSSDIVNSADSVIGVKRNIKSNKLTIEHIKNRSGEEIKGKVIEVNNDNNQAYIWEVGDVKDKESQKSKPEECADKLLAFFEEKAIKVFSRKDITFIETEYSHETITKAIRLLKNDGVLLENGGGKYITYSVNLSTIVKVSNQDVDENSQKLL